MPSDNPFDALMPTTVRAFGRRRLRRFWWPANISLRMTAPEAAFFSSILQRNRASPYLEFGAGGSTLLAAGIVAQLISVENDLQFIQWLNRRLKILPSVVKPQFVPIDQGPHEKWGLPITDEPELLKLYAETVWQRSLVPPTVKTVLVDGRFRRSCLLHCALYLDTSVDILLHDASRYADMIPGFFDVAEKVDNLQLLHKKPSLTGDQILAKLSEVQYDKS